MTNNHEWDRWLKDARAYLEDAEANLEIERWRTVVINAQLCIELTAKAIISCFEETKWSHSPGKQLKEILDRHVQVFSERAGQEMASAIERLTTDADIVSVWHGKATYGEWDKDKKQRTPSIDLCTGDKARWLIEIARRSLTTADDFIKEWSEASRDEDS